jgi:G:T/U-mismatch repair DNA glycosylase
MTIIRHRFIDHKINPQTETLIVGTFNPETSDNEADFFYGRQRNFLWTLIPTAFGDSNLKGKPKTEKINFIQKRKIDFIDLVSEVKVDEVSNYYDGYLDSRVSEWRNVISEIEKLSNIKRVCFTRKSFSDIPEMKTKIENVGQFCAERKIHFQYLTTPARFYRADKQTEWTNFLNNGN